VIDPLENPMPPQSDHLKNWLNRPESPHQPLETPRQRQETAPMALKIAEGSDVREGAIRASTPKPVDKPLESYTPGGTYIPLSGGSRGWYDNSAVPASETRNHYRFGEALEANAFKQTILERIETFNRRASERYKVELLARHSVPGHASQDPAEHAFCTDLSVKGACLRVRRHFEIGTPLTVAFYRKQSDMKAGEALTSLQAIVRKTRSAGGSPASPRYYAGIQFQDISIESKEVIANLLAGATAIVQRN
jgi:hypothetical protein